MNNEEVQDLSTHKKGRHRKKLLYSSILKQMEFYFSDASLSKDRFLSKLIEDDPNVNIDIFMKFNKIRKLTESKLDIVTALKKSEVLKLSEDENSVCRISPPSKRDNVDLCTIYVENIQPDTNHDSLTKLFGDFGNVVYVSIPKYKQNRMNKGFAFVEFETEDQLVAALEYFEKIGHKMSSKISPEHLKSITTFENSNEGSGHCDESNPQKRKVEDDDEINKADTLEINPEKKLKIDDTSNQIEVPAEIDISASDKAKIKKFKKKSVIKELGLQVLSKQEWKKLRNHYLDMQRQKMKQLKLHLKKRKHHKAELNVVKEENRVYGTTAAKSSNFVPNVLVRLTLNDSSTEAKKLKNEIKSLSPAIKYVEVPHEVSNREVVIRFSDEKGANDFLSGGVEKLGSGELLTGKDEEQYWKKIEQVRNIKLKKEQPKCRGREKLLKKAVKDSEKHIRFGDGDE